MSQNPSNIIFPFGPKLAKASLSLLLLSIADKLDENDMENLANGF